jgi:hypothetical protein
VPIVPKKEEQPDEGESRPRSIWATDGLWAEIALEAKREGYSASKFATFLLRGGLQLHRAERAAEAGKSASDEKPK